MWGEFWNVSSQFIRICMLNICSLIFCFRLIELVTPRRNSWFWAGVYIFYRVAVVQFLVDGLLYYYFKGELWMSCLQLTAVMFNAFFSYFFLYLVFEGTLLRLAAVSWCAEVIASLSVMVSLVTLNLLEGIPYLAEMYVPFSAMDLLLFPIMYLLYRAARLLLGRFAERIRAYEPRRRRLLWFLIGIYIFFTLFSHNWSSSVDLFRENWVYCFTIPFGMFVFWAAGMETLEKHRRIALSEREYLHIRQSLAESSYFELRRQITAIRSYQSVIDAQMEEIRSCGGNLRSLRCGNYIRELQNVFSAVRGTYCTDWETDALLCQEERRCRGENIRMDIQFHAFDRGNLESGKVLHMLRELLELMHRHLSGAGDRAVRFAAAAYKNQLVIRLLFPPERKRLPSIRKLRRDASSCQGTARIRTDGGMCEILVMLPTD